MRGVEYARRGDSESRTKAAPAAVGRCPVEASVGALNQCGRGFAAVGAAGDEAKAVDAGEDASRGDLEDRAGEAGPALRGSPVEVPVRALEQGGQGRAA